MLTKERKGEIAYALLKYRLKKEGIHLDAVNREIGNAAMATHIPRAELHEFVKETTEELITEAFKKAAG